MQEPVIEFDFTKEFRDRFQEALDARDAPFIRESLESVKAADITALLYQFNSEESKYVMDLLSIGLQAEIINDLKCISAARDEIDQLNRRHARPLLLAYTCNINLTSVTGGR